MHESGETPLVTLPILDAQPIGNLHPETTQNGKLPQLREQCRGCAASICESGCPADRNISDWMPQVEQAVHYEELVAEGGETATWARAQADMHWTLAYKAMMGKSIHDRDELCEFTGRACPAPCQGLLNNGNQTGCLYNSTNAGRSESVPIRSGEYLVMEHAYRLGLVQPPTPEKLNGKHVVIVGAGPAGLAAAMKFLSAGCRVTIIDREKRPGGLLTYGVPNKKISYETVDRRIQTMLGVNDEARQRGLINDGEQLLEFKMNTSLVADSKDGGVTLEELSGDYDEVHLAIGMEIPRRLYCSGEKHAVPAMSFLRHSIELELGDRKSDAGPDQEPIDESLVATGKDMLVVGGRDTGQDCVHTGNKQGCKSVDVLIRDPDDKAFLKKLSAKSAYTEKDIGPYNPIFGKEVTKIEEVEIETSRDGETVTKKKVTFTNGEEKLYDIVVVAAGYTNPDLESAGVTSPAVLEEPDHNPGVNGVLADDQPSGFGQWLKGRMQSWKWLQRFVGSPDEASAAEPLPPTHATVLGMSGTDMYQMVSQFPNVHIVGDARLNSHIEGRNGDRVDDREALIVDAVGQGSALASALIRKWEAEEQGHPIGIPRARSPYEQSTS